MYVTLFTTRKRRHGCLRLLPLGRETIESLRQLRVGGSAPVPHLLSVLSRRHPSRLRGRLPQPTRRLDAANGGRLAPTKECGMPSEARQKRKMFDGRSPTAVLLFGLRELRWERSRFISTAAALRVDGV